jgi:hypothetical protein
MLSHTPPHPSVWPCSYRSPFTVRHAAPRARLFKYELTGVRANFFDACLAVPVRPVKPEKKPPAFAAAQNRLTFPSRFF